MRAGTPQFFRRMPERVAIKLFDTGIGLNEGAPDPHWQFVARGDQPHVKPRPAAVTAAVEGWWLANDVGPSKWISTANGPPELPNGVTYTFRTTFELVHALPATAVLRGRVMADDWVKAIRLNGKDLRPPERREMGIPWDRYGEFSAEKGFVEGVNTLEIDVMNEPPPGSEKNPGASAMGLRVELDGSVVCEPPGEEDSPRGKEGAAMN